jgi:hypothetical protein
VTDKPPLLLEEVSRILSRLRELVEEPDVVLVGGQAVAFWTRYLAARATALDGFDFLTSKDIDFAGDRVAAERAGVLLDARLVRIPAMDEHTPNTGVVVFADSSGVERERELDFSLTRRSASTHTTCTARR